MQTTLTQTPPTADAAQPAQPGRLFNAEDFAVAELDPPTIWDRIITVAVREQASDVHLTYQHDGLHVALRLDGRLNPQGTIPTALGQRLTNLIKVLARLDISDRRRPQDGHIDLQIDGRAINLRVSVLPTNHGEALAVRILDHDTGRLALEQLGLSSHQLRDLRVLLESPSGLVLVSGGTGAGKTTTLYALLERLASEPRKIVTVEDPIEYDLPGIEQSQVQRRLGLGFATLLASVLRQDPNVVMVGEVRDAETAETVVQAANSGRLVFATTHAAHSAAAIETLIALGAHPHFVARSFRGAVAQTLVRRLCPYCTVRLDETADAHLLADVRPYMEPDEQPVLSVGRGCAHCRHTGYRGRVGIFEVLVADDELRGMISRGVPSRDVYDRAAQHNGMLTISIAGRLAAARGLTTIEELMQSISEIWTGSL